MPEKGEYTLANTGPNSLNIEQLVASGTREVIASVEKQTTAMLLRDREMFYESEKRITDNIRRSEQSVIAGLETKATDSKTLKLAVVGLPSVLTIVLGLVVGALQMKTNQKIDTSSKQISTRLALTEEFYKRKFTVYDNAYKQMLQLLAAVRNLESNPKDKEAKKEASDRLTQLYLSSRTNGLYMTKDVSNELSDVWFTATQVPQLNTKGTKDMRELEAKMSDVEDKMRNELLGNIIPLREEGR